MRKFASCMLAMVMLLCLFVPTASAAEPTLQHNYSSTANSGIRHEVCTTLEGTSVDTYYTGDYAAEELVDLSGDALLQVLRSLMTSTHSHVTEYGDCRDYAVKTDCENGDGVTINLMYSSFVSNRGEYINDTSKGWNREHVWPQSLGGFSTSGAGADLHHIRPTDSSLNGTRGNLKYGIVTSGSEMYGTVVTNSAHGGKKNSTYMEPLDNVKGDVARICLYVWARYGGELAKCSTVTNVFESIDVLLQWHEMDPVDTWEMGRNEVVYAIQGNRNVFIDYPELAWKVFGREVPEDAVLPSGGVTKEPCAHANTEMRNHKDASCGLTGYTGDTFCTDCGDLVKVGKSISATGKHTFGDWQATSDGLYESHKCTVCSFTERREASADNTMVIVIAGTSAAVVAAGAAVVVILLKKKKN